MILVKENVTKSVETVRAGKDSEYLRINLVQVPGIQYLITFKKKSVLVLFDLDSEVNAIHSTFAKKLDLSIRLIDVRAWKINDTMLNTYKIVVAAFLVIDIAN